MILRGAALLLLAYALGFILFAFTLGKPASPSAPSADAVVVLTGGSGRIEHGVGVLRSGKAKRLLVAGADPAVTKADIVTAPARLQPAQEGALNVTIRNNGEGEATNAGYAIYQRTGAGAEKGTSARVR